MFIYSVTPAHMLVEQQGPSDLEVLEVPGGYAEGRRTPRGFQVARLCSTDPAMYLKPDFAPGSYRRE